MTSLRVALIDGPTYAPLYDVIPAFTAKTGIAVEIGARLPHAALNDLLATELDAFDLISTHIKYAPSQADHLLPLDDLLTASEIESFRDGPLAHCRIAGRLLQLPRHTDTRLLVYRRDWFEDPATRERFCDQHGRELVPPRTWHDLLEVATFFASTPKRHDQPRFGFAFCGQPSGLFGAFFELLISAGGSLVDGSGHLDLTSEEAHWALGYLRDLHVVRRATPPEMLDWDFGDVTNAFMDGRIAMIGDWPGSFGLLTDPARSAIADSIDITMYPEGPAGFRRVYSGSHSFAITRGCRDTDAARELLLTLTGIEAQLIEGRRGSVPTRRDVASILQAEATTPFERKRLALLGETIASDMISFPPLASYPRIEEIAWPALSAALHDQVSVASALTTAHRQVNDDLQIGREFARRPTS